MSNADPNDHRCVYGHLVPRDFTFAVEQRVCPTCGAPTVTVAGYRLARTMTSEVPLDAMDAFNTVRFIEAGYTLTPKDAPEEGPGGDQYDVEISEVEVDPPSDLSAQVQIPEEPQVFESLDIEAETMGVESDAASEVAPVPAAAMSDLERTFFDSK